MYSAQSPIPETRKRPQRTTLAEGLERSPKHARWDPQYIVLIDPPKRRMEPAKLPDLGIWLGRRVVDMGMHVWRSEEKWRDRRLDSVFYQHAEAFKKPTQDTLKPLPPVSMVACHIEPKQRVFKDCLIPLYDSLYPRILSRPSRAVWYLPNRTGAWKTEKPRVEETPRLIPLRLEGLDRGLPEFARAVQLAPIRQLSSWLQTRELSTMARPRFWRLPRHTPSLKLKRAPWLTTVNSFGSARAALEVSVPRLNRTLIDATSDLPNVTSMLTLRSLATQPRLRLPGNIALSLRREQVTRLHASEDTQTPTSHSPLTHTSAPGADNVASATSEPSVFNHPFTYPTEATTLRCWTGDPECDVNGISS
eukprot:Blabericola_migrator_1__2665@NODE_1755_length_3849_cov_16_576150_g1132_i0_p2_GENE_NODE_1755_length_3849_cov_16_576150_g1132_i0NODE_1755_length_3849_cov_16_576150_g1132_i0_p2_ORF_typecomplete_len363_score41_90_NODE_1755_length_3849_cov_16_576150_g1132_i06811769